ncbi:MAG: hypothetical protein R3F19_01555 [Verrucomicrobiales bacterium]
MIKRWKEIAMPIRSHLTAIGGGSAFLSQHVRRCLVWCLVLLGMLVAGYLMEDYKGRVAWNAFRTHWEAKGEVFDLSASTSQAQAVPDDDNFARMPLFEEFFRLRNSHPDPREFYLWPQPRHGGDIDPAKGRLYGLLGAIKGDGERFRPIPVAAWKNRDLPRDWRGAVAVPLYRTEKLGRKAGAKPRLSEPEAATSILSRVNEHWAGEWAALREETHREWYVPPSPSDTFRYWDNTILFELASHCQLRFSAYAKEGDSEAALVEWRMMLRLASYLERSRSTFSAHRLTVRSVQSLWEGARQHRWSEAQLTEIQSSLDEVSSNLEVHALAYLRRYRNEQIDSILDPVKRREWYPPHNNLTAAARHLVPEGWIRQNALTAARPLQDYALTDSNGEPLWNELCFDRLDEWQEEFDRLQFYYDSDYGVTLRHPYHLLSSAGYPIDPETVRVSIFQKATLDVVIAGIACERHFLVRGQYPAALEELVPAYLETLPLDRYTGNPLKYKQQPDGTPVVWSVGANGTDENATPVQDRDFGDIVWQYRLSDELLAIEKRLETAGR